MKKLFFTLILMTTGLFFMAQSVAGDYRSVAGSELEWTDNTTWEKFDGTDWTTPAASDYPAFGGAAITYTVTIQVGSDVSYGLSNPYILYIGSAGQPGELVIESGGTLTIFSTFATQLNIADVGTVTVEGNLNCIEDIENAGILTVNGTLRNFLP